MELHPSTPQQAPTPPKSWQTMCKQGPGEIKLGGLGRHTSTQGSEGGVSGNSYSNISASLLAACSPVVSIVCDQSRAGHSAPHQPQHSGSRVGRLWIWNRKKKRKTKTKMPGMVAYQEYLGGTEERTPAWPTKWVLVHPGQQTTAKKERNKNQTKWKRKILCLVPDPDPIPKTQSLLPPS